MEQIKAARALKVRDERNAETIKQAAERTLMNMSDLEEKASNRIRRSVGTRIEKIRKRRNE